MSVPWPVDCAQLEGVGGGHPSGASRQNQRVVSFRRIPASNRKHTWFVFPNVSVSQHAEASTHESLTNIFKSTTFFFSSIKARSPWSTTTKWWFTESCSRYMHHKMALVIPGRAAVPPGLPRSGACGKSGGSLAERGGTFSLSRPALSDGLHINRRLLALQLWCRTLSDPSGQFGTNVVRFSLFLLRFLLCWPTKRFTGIEIR